MASTSNPSGNGKKKETKEVPLKSGIVAVHKRNGDIHYQASVGSPPGRKQYTFPKLGLAEEYKDFGDSYYDLHGVAPTKQQFFAARTAPVESATPGVTVKVAVIATMVLKIAEEIADDYRDDDSLMFAVRVYLRWLKDAGLKKATSDALDRQRAKQFRKWLHAENYDRNTQSTILTVLRRIMAEAAGCGFVAQNDFLDLRPSKKALPPHRRDGTRRHREDAPAWTPRQIVAIASVLRPCYVFAFWLLAVLGLRISEATGLRVRDWVCDRPYLRVQWQRRGSPRLGLSDLKTAASKRILPVGPTMADMFDAYIERMHGPMPTDPVAKEAWLDAYLLVGVKGGPMNQDSLRRAVRKATVLLDLAQDEVLRRLTLHHLRKTVGSLLQSSVGGPDGLTGRAVSDYLGHKTAATPGVDGAAQITREHYNPSVLSQLSDIAEFLDAWLTAEVLPHLVTGDLLEPTSVPDGIPLEEAARRLTGQLAPTVTEEDILQLVADSTLHATTSSDIGAPGEQQQLLVSADDVDQLLAALVRSNDDTYCATEVAALLQTDHAGVYRRAQDGDIEEVTVDALWRRSRHGNRGGALPGGGRRFSKASVDAVVELEADRLKRLRSWLTVGETAEMLFCSPDTVRRMADRGQLVAWRDERGRRERRLCPDSVMEHRRRSDVPFYVAANEAAVSVAKIAALVKVGELRAGVKPKTVQRASLDEYLGRPGSSAA